MQLAMMNNPTPHSVHTLMNHSFYSNNQLSDPNLVETEQEDFHHVSHSQSSPSLQLHSEQACSEVATGSNASPQDALANYYIVDAEEQMELLTQADR